MRAATLAVAAAALLACGATPAKTGKDNKDGKAGKQQGSIFGEGTRVPNPGVREPSGIVFHPRLGHLFVVGDEGTLAELDGQGRFVRAFAVRGNIEDVTVHEPSGDLVIVDEMKAHLLVVDPATGAVKATWKLDADEIVGKREGGRDGFEGVGFRPQPGQPGGGLFYLTHQRGPAMLVAIAFDPAAAPRKLGAADVVARWPLKGHQDLTAVSWSKELRRLLVLADSEDELLLIDPDRGGADAQDARFKIPGLNQEGVCLDPAGAMWIADDRGGSVTRYAGALKLLERRATPGS
jgi:uncharacterized protein YjiK